jgi:hypothetical protein
MNRIRLFVTFIVALHLGGMLSPLLAQTPNQGIEQQIRSQYPIRSVVIVRQDGINALPSPAIWPCNTYKQGSGITQPKLCEANYSLSKNRTRPLKTGEKAYLIAIQYKPPEVVLKVQTIPGDATEAPFGAAISFEFKKGAYVSFSTIQEWIGDVFSLTPPEPPRPEAIEAPPVITGDNIVIDDPAKPALPLPSTCVNAQTPADQIHYRNLSSGPLIIPKLAEPTIIVSRSIGGLVNKKSRLVIHSKIGKYAVDLTRPYLDLNEPPRSLFAVIMPTAEYSRSEDLEVRVHDPDQSHTITEFLGQTIFLQLELKLSVIPHSLAQKVGIEWQD